MMIRSFGKRYSTLPQKTRQYFVQTGEARLCMQLWAPVLTGQDRIKVAGPPPEVLRCRKGTVMAKAFLEGYQIWTRVLRFNSIPLYLVGHAQQNFPTSGSTQSALPSLRERHDIGRRRYTPFGPREL